MGFQKGNKLGNGRPKGALNKKTIIKDSLNKLNEVGLYPLETSKELINSLLTNSDMNTNEKIKLLNVTTNLMKYELLTMSEIANLDEQILLNEELKKENETLKLTTNELLQQLKKED
jgi:hypothetical protein